MRIPNEALRETIQIEDYDGAGAYGVVLAPARTIRASVQQTDRLVVDTNGRQMLASALIMIRPEAGPVSIESKITWGDEVLRVVRAFPIPDTFRPSHWEITAVPWDAAPVMSS